MSSCRTQIIGSLAVLGLAAAGCRGVTGPDASPSPEVSVAAPAPTPSPAPAARPSATPVGGPSGAPGGEPDAASAAPSPAASTEPAAVRAPSAPSEPSAPPAPSAVPPPAVPPPAATPGPDVIRVPLQIDDQSDGPAGFTSAALSILTDDRGWVRAGFVFTADPDAHNRLVLAEGAEVDRLCLPYDTYGRYSCQNGPVVALNADRWREATPEWTGSLADYRTYLVNHEVGHLLHLHHPSPQCPGTGFPAPIMLQQSTGLGACTANPWPLPWEIDLAAEQREPMAPPADHDVSGHRPAPPKQRQDLGHTAQ